MNSWIKCGKFSLSDLDLLVIRCESEKEFVYKINEDRSKINAMIRICREDKPAEKETK